MPNRKTSIGELRARDPAAARAEVTRVLTRCQGCITTAARDLDIERRTMLRHVHRFGLWPLVWSLRRVGVRFQLPDEIKRGLESA